MHVLTCLQNEYDDFFDTDYQEPLLQAGQCISADVCGPAPLPAEEPQTPPAPPSSPSPPPPPPTATKTTSSSGKRRHNRRALLAPAPVPSSPATERQTAGAATEDKKDAKEDEKEAEAEGPADMRTEMASETNLPDTADGKGYDPDYGEGPFGESLCDARPGRSFNYFGCALLVRVVLLSTASRTSVVTAFFLFAPRKQRRWSGC